LKDSTSWQRPPGLRPILSFIATSSARLEPGQTLKMIDTEGQQAIDFLCYSAELPLDRINIPTAVRLNKSLYITKGSMG
jgi:uncharacterized protein